MWSFLQGVLRSLKPAYFDSEWEDLIFQVKIDSDSGIIIRVYGNPTNILFAGFSVAYPDSIWIFTDYCVDKFTESAGCGFYIPELDFRYGLPLQRYRSVCSSELYAILSAFRQVLKLETG